MEDVLAELLMQSSVKTVIMDGGMGTTTEDRGVDTQNSLWGSFALLTPEGRRINDEIHRDFVTAGAQFLIANTHDAFRSSSSDLLERDDLETLNLPSMLFTGDKEKQSDAVHSYVIRAAVESARAAVPADRKVVVATCVGSTDTPYAIESSISAETVSQLLQPEIEQRLSAEGDLLIFETLTTFDEIKGTSSAVRDSRVSNFAIGLTCGGDGRTLGGVSMDEAVEQFAQNRPRVFFIQCTRFDLVEKALFELKRVLAPDDVIGVYANDGRSWDHSKMQWATSKRITPELYAQHALKWRKAGARVIGGCCGTSPEHIAMLTTLLNPQT